MSGRPDRSGWRALADNFIGYDDGFDTPGERLGRGANALALNLYRDPMGVVRNALGGVKEDLDYLMFEGGAMENPANVLGYAAAPMAPGARGLMRNNPNVANAVPLMGGGKSDPTKTGWTFKDVDTSLNSSLSKAENRRIGNDTSRVERVPIRQLNAMQDSVNPDFSSTTSSQGELPLVIRKNGKMYVRDGHHRLTKLAEDGGSMADVRFIDLDNAPTDTPLFDWQDQSFSEMDDDILRQLFGG